MELLFSICSPGCISKSTSSDEIISSTHRYPGPLRAPLLSRYSSCSSMTSTTSSPGTRCRPSTMMLLALGGAPLLSSTMICDRPLFRLGLLLISRTSERRRDERPPCELRRGLRTTISSSPAMAVVVPVLLLVFIRDWMSQQIRRKPATLPSTMPTTVPGSGPSVL